MRKITIVVPVYGDWSSLSDCIKSLKEYVDTTKHKIIFVNDCGPEAKAIGSKLKAAIKGIKNVHYYENKTNLGFLKTCNKAVLELDDTDNDILLLNSDAAITKNAIEEMGQVLYLSEKHGAVSPRSNNATITSVPLRIDEASNNYPIKRSDAVYAAIKDKLPRVSIIPSAQGFCILIKRSLIKKHGLFDEIYGKGYCEESDFCQRIKQHGYISVMANHAFVYHERSKSFGLNERSERIAKNEKILLGRYPNFNNAVQRYLFKDIDPVDWFSDLFVKEDKKKILVNISYLSKEVTNKSLVNSFISSIVKDKTYDNYELAIGASRESYEYFNLDHWKLRKVILNEVDERFHVGICLKPITDPTDLWQLRRHCLRFIFPKITFSEDLQNLLLSEVDLVELRSSWQAAVLADDRGEKADTPRLSLKTRLIKKIKRI